VGGKEKEDSVRRSSVGKRSAAASAGTGRNDGKRHLFIFYNKRGGKGKERKKEGHIPASTLGRGKGGTNWGRTGARLGGHEEGLFKDFTTT